MARRSDTVFFRLLKTSIDDKGDTLAAQIAALNASREAEETYVINPADFSLIPGSPFAYWVSDSIRQLFARLPQLESEGRAARVGDHPGSHDRYIRLFWEVSCARRSKTRQWLPYQKGGDYSLYYADIHLVADWDLVRQTYYDFHGRPGRSSEHPSNYQFFFRPGLTWPRRTQKGLNLRAMPAGCIFADKGPVAFVPDDHKDGLLALLATMNSLPFKMVVELQMAFGSYEVGVIQRTPIPPLTEHATRHTLSSLAQEAHDLQRDRDRSDETTHAFGLPALVHHTDRSLLEGSLALEAAEQARAARLAEIQAEIDELVFDLYGLGEADRALVRAEMGDEQQDTEHAPRHTGESETDEEAPAPPEDLPARVQNLLQWCVGVAFGRWDVRFALDPTLLPALQGPFDPLPRCAPGALVGPDGLPPDKAENIAPEAWLRARQNILDIPPATGQTETNYPLSIAWDGILIDDPTHPADIVARVRAVLTLLWGERAGAIEREACEVLGFRTLRDVFRDPRKGLFPFHIKRYSKSRRKAPIYWLLQSESRSYAIWLYVHRMRPDVLYTAGREYADAKVALEEGRLTELGQGLEGLEASARRRREREIERQQKLVAEVTAFRSALDRVALLNLPPDLNDGVVISIAPLWELVPWKEAKRTWDRLVAGEYEWSTMGGKMRERGLVR